MEKITLESYLEEHSQASVARDLGLSDMAITKMVRSNRQIYIVVEDGKVKAFEIKELGDKEKVK